MEDIAAKLLMTKGSVYYYFKDKQDLLYQSYKMLLEHSIDNIEEILEETIPWKDKLKKAMVVHIVYLISERSGFEFGMKPEHFFSGKKLENILELRSKYGAYFDQMILQGIKENAFSEVDVKVVRNIILGALNWVIHWYSPTGEKSEEEMAELISDYLLRILIKET